MSDWKLVQGDCLEVMLGMADDSVDLVFTSPPYEAARTYGINFTLKGEEWVWWAYERFVQCLRVCKGLVCWVVDGQTRNFRWSGTPHLLAADLIRAGYWARRDCVYHRVGIPGSGGPDYFRGDTEFVLVFQRVSGKLPWSENTACGEPCKWGVGGAMSNRTSDGQRRNAKTGTRLKKLHTKREPNGKMRQQQYEPPELANPGNVIHCKVGGGRMGSDLAHETEAPFPESLVKRFVLSFCPPGGTVLDPFCGSGTTGAICRQTRRQFMGIDIRESQIVLSERRIRQNLQEPLFT